MIRIIKERYNTKRLIHDDAEKNIYLNFKASNVPMFSHNFTLTVCRSYLKIYMAVTNLIYLFFSFTNEIYSQTENTFQFGFNINSRRHREGRRKDKKQKQNEK